MKPVLWTSGLIYFLRCAHLEKSLFLILEARSVLMLLWALEVLHWQRCEHCRKAVLVGSSLHHFSLCFSATVLDHSSTSGLWAFCVCICYMMFVFLWCRSRKVLISPWMACLMFSLEFLPGRFQHLSMLLFRLRPTKLVKNFAQFWKGNELRVVLRQIITRYPPLSIDPPVSLKVEVITSWPQNCSLPLGLARNAVKLHSLCWPFVVLWFFWYLSASSSCSSSDFLSSLHCLRIRPLAWPRRSGCHLAAATSCRGITLGVWTQIVVIRT